MCPDDSLHGVDCSDSEDSAVLDPPEIKRVEVFCGVHIGYDGYLQSIIGHTSCKLITTLNRVSETTFDYKVIRMIRLHQIP